MADLDDFFAKKDRKKPKTSKKFATSDEVAEKLKDKKPEPPKIVRKEPQPAAQPQLEAGEENENAGEQLTVQLEQDDEWLEFEEEGRKDYSGLKIQNLQLDDEHQYASTDGDDGDGEGEGGDNERGAWKKGAGEPNTNSKAEASKAEAKSSADSKSKNLASTSNGRYVSPAMRQGQLLQAVRLKRDALPDINNEAYFPTLDDAKKEEQRKKKVEPAFEEVRSGARFQRSSDLANNAPVSVGNRYNSLADS